MRGLKSEGEESLETVKKKDEQFRVEVELIQKNNAKIAIRK